jgi:hypothetical protein
MLLKSYYFSTSLLEESKYIYEDQTEEQGQREVTTVIHKVNKIIP